MTRSVHRIAAAALLALATGAFLPAHAATSDPDLAGSVQSALNSSLGDDASKLTVTSRNGRITLHGWTKGPKEEAKARMVASKVPGVAKVYSSVRTFSTDNDE